MHIAEMLRRHRHQAEALEVQIRQFAQPVGAIEIGPFGAQNRQALTFDANLPLQLLDLADRMLRQDVLVIRPIAEPDHRQCRQKTRKSPHLTSPPPIAAGPGSRG